MQATYGITDIAYNYRPIMGGEERRELIYEGFVNYRLNQGTRKPRQRLMRMDKLTIMLHARPTDMLIGKMLY